jgi:hypothetical protein
MIDLGVITYINNIVIYSQIREKHEKLIKEELTPLWKSNLAASIDKYEFHKYVIELFSNIISDIDIHPAQDEV